MKFTWQAFSRDRFNNRITLKQDEIADYKANLSISALCLKEEVELAKAELKEQFGLEANVVGQTGKNQANGGTRIRRSPQIEGNYR